MSEQTCYLCKGSSVNVIRKRLRYDIQRNVLKCDDCGLVYLEPNTKDLSEYYKGDYRTMYSPEPGRKMTSREIFDMNLPFQSSRIKDLEPILRPDSRVLDVGCSSGFFLHSIASQVGERVGIEFNKDDAAFVNDELGIKTYSSPIEETDLEPGSFDLITLFHVLEHIDDPVRLMASLRPYLKPDGHLFIEVPNVNDALLSAYQTEAYADFWYREPHVMNFSPDTLKRTLADAGFEGQTHTFQRYSLLNHLNWVMNGQPQKNMVVGMGEPALVGEEAGVPPETRSALNDWMIKANSEYKDLLDAHGLGDCIRFLGSPA